MTFPFYQPQLTPEAFREVVENDRMTMADEKYSREIEALQHSRDYWRQNSAEWHKAALNRADEIRDLQRRLDAAEKERDEKDVVIHGLQKTREMFSEEITRLTAQLAQRRDMTLTAVQLAKGSWRFDDANTGKVACYAHLTAAADEALERWSRERKVRHIPKTVSDYCNDCHKAFSMDEPHQCEGKVEPSTIHGLDRLLEPESDEPLHVQADGSVCRCPEGGPHSGPHKPPAPDLAALRRRVEHAIGDLGIGVLTDVAFDNYVRALVKETL